MPASDEDADNDWHQALLRLAEGHRTHAGYWAQEAVPSIAELGVVQGLAEALEEFGQSFFSNVRHRDQGEDPPDCEAENRTGQRIAIEVTELVDGVSAAKARAGECYDWKDWGDELVPRLNSLIQRKDGATTIKGGPYTEYVLVINTDEPGLEAAWARARLSNYVFPATSLITRAFLLLSYCPFEQRCPCIELRIDQP